MGKYPRSRAIELPIITAKVTKMDRVCERQRPASVFMMVDPRVASFRSRHAVPANPLFGLLSQNGCAQTKKYPREAGTTQLKATSQVAASPNPARQVSQPRTD
jgi:hypothetical protein